MISLLVHSCCHKCPNFEVGKLGPAVEYANDEIVSVGDIILYCKNVSLCETLAQYLKDCQNINEP